MAALQYYTRYTDASIIILEADKKPYLLDMVKSRFPNVKYLLVKDEK